MSAPQWNFVALGFELGTEFLEVVDLTVEDNDDAAVLIGHGLSAGLGQVEDRQAAEAEGNAAVDKLTAHVGTADGTMRSIILVSTSDWLSVPPTKPTKPHIYYPLCCCWASNRISSF